MDDCPRSWVWKLIPIAIPPCKHPWRKFLNISNSSNYSDESDRGIYQSDFQREFSSKDMKLDECDGMSKDLDSSDTPSNGSERLFSTTILPNGFEKITVVVMNKPCSEKIDNCDTTTECNATSTFNETNKDVEISRLSHAENLDFEPCRLQERDCPGPSFNGIISRERRKLHNLNSVMDQRNNSLQYGPEYYLRHSIPVSNIQFYQLDNVCNSNNFMDERPYNPNIKRKRFRRKNRKNSWRSPREYYNHSQPTNRTPAQRRLEQLSRKLKTDNNQESGRGVRVKGLPTNENANLINDGKRGESYLNKVNNEIGNNDARGSEGNGGQNSGSFNGGRFGISSREKLKRSSHWKEEEEELGASEAKKSKEEENEDIAPILNDLKNEKNEKIIFYQSKPISREGIKLEEVVETSSKGCSTIGGVTKQPATDRLNRIRQMDKSKVVNNSKRGGDNGGQLLKKSTQENRTIENAQSTSSKSPPASSLLDDESMEWQDIPFELIDSEIKDVRKNPLPLSSKSRNEVGFIGSNFDVNSVPCLEVVHIVIDTNVILSSLELVRQLVETCVCGVEIVVVIPWQVLCELDCLKTKSSNNVSKRARRASSFLSGELSRNHPRLKCQPPSLHKSCVDCLNPEIPDDYILLACLQLKRNNHYMILLTNDKNLIAKSQASDVPAFDEISIMKVINQKNFSSVTVDLEEPPTNKDNAVECTMAHRLSKVFFQFLTQVVEKKMKDHYGALWAFYLVKVPPWNFIDCICNARSNWDIVNFDRDKHYEQLSKLNSIEIFLKNTTYSSMNAMKLQSLFEDCCSLAEWIPYHDMADKFTSQAHCIINETLMLEKNRSLSPVVDVIDSLEEVQIVDEERANYVIKLFDHFTCKVVAICGCLYKMMKLDWPCNGEIPGSNLDLTEEEAEEFHKLTKITLETIIKGLKKIEKTERGKVSVNTPGVFEVQKYLVEYTCDEGTSMQDIVHFSNSESVRINMKSGIDDLEKILNMYIRIG